MTQRIINIGAKANDSSGDKLRTAFEKINNNFTELYNATGGLDLLSINSNLLPTTDILYDLGSPTKRWRHVYVGPGSVTIGNVELSVVNGKITSSAGFDLEGSTVPSSSSLVNGSKTVSLDGNLGNLTFTNGEEIRTNVGGIQLYQSSDNTIGIYPGEARINTFATGGAKHTWTFDEDGLTQFPVFEGGSLFIQGGELGSAISGIGISAKDNIFITADILGETSKQWQFGTDGRLSLPAGRTYEYPNTPLTGHGDGLARLSFSLVSDGVGVTWLAGLPSPVGSGYSVGNTFTFGEEFLGIPDASVTITVNAIGPGGSIDEVAFTIPPLYPADIYRDSPINLQVGDVNNRWTFGYTGRLTLPGELYVKNDINGAILGDQSTGGLNINAYEAAGFALNWNTLSVGGTPSTNPEPGNPAFSTENSSVEFGWNGINLIVNGTDANSTWTFGPTGNLTLPSGFITSNAVTGVNLRSGYDVSIISNNMGVAREWIFDYNGNIKLPLNGDIKAGVIEEVGTILYDINSYDTFETVFLDLDTNLAYTWNVAQQSLLDVGADLVGWKFRGENSETLYTVIDAVVDGSSLTLTTEDTGLLAPMDMLIFYSPDYLAKQAGPLDLVVDDKTLTIGTDGSITLPLNGEIRSRVVAQVGSGSSITAYGWGGAVPGERKARWDVSYWANADLVAVGTDLVGWVFNPVGTTDYYTVTSAEFVDGGATLELIFAERSLPLTLGDTIYTVRSPGYFERQASDITLVADESSWTLGTDGNITLPDGAKIKSTTSLEGQLEIEVPGAMTAEPQTWRFTGEEGIGALYFPDGGRYIASTLYSAVDSDLEFIVANTPTVSAEAFHGGLNDLIFDISENDDITVVGPGWELNVGSELAPIWATVAQASIDQSGNYEIIFSENYDFEDFATYTFRSPTTQNYAWTIRSQTGGLVGPGGVVITNETAPLDGGDTYRELAIELPAPGALFNEQRWVFANDGALKLPQYHQIESVGSNATITLNGVGSNESIISLATILDGETIGTAFDMHPNGVSLNTVRSIDIHAGYEDGTVLRDFWQGREEEWVNLREQDAQLSGVTRPWAGMPSYEAVDEIANYNYTGPNPPPDSLAPVASTANNAYLAWQTEQAAINVTVSATDKTWTFGNNGELTVPGAIRKNGALYLNSGGETNSNSATVLVNGQGGNLTLRTSNGTDFQSLTFDANGVLTLPPRGSINTPGGAIGWASADDINFNLILNSTNSVGIRSFGKTWTFNTSGELTLPNSTVVRQSTNDEVTAADTAYTTAMAAWETFRVNTLLPYVTNEIVTLEGWPFVGWDDITGTNASDYSTTLTTAWMIQQSPSSPPTPLMFSPAITADMYNQLRSYITSIATTYATWLTMEPSIDIVADTTIFSVLGNDKLQVPGIVQTAEEEDIVIRTRYSVPSSPSGTTTIANNDFVFGSNGTLTFPDATIQTSAYVSNITSKTTNGNSILYLSEIVSKDRLQIRIVYAATNSLNVEFYYSGQGSIVTITANNGTNIFAGTTSGYNIGWQQFNPTALTTAGDKAEVVISDMSYNKMYRVTAMMREVPTGDNGTGAVLCVIEKLI